MRLCIFARDNNYELIYNGDEKNQILSITLRYSDENKKIPEKFGINLDPKLRHLFGNKFFLCSSYSTHAYYPKGTFQPSLEVFNRGYEKRKKLLES